MTGALSGLRVVEVGTDIAAPYCTKLLVDLGADVYKVESRTGDPLRDWGPSGGLFDYLNAGKHGIIVDFASHSDALVELIAQADLVIENLPAG
ncbi:MAG: CoA transferase, partial [Mycobacterium sp.]|nr:CoA transferase [Mycobacterium sp.]